MNVFFIDVLINQFQWSIEEIIEKLHTRNQWEITHKKSIGSHVISKSRTQFLDVMDPSGKLSAVMQVLKQFRSVCSSDWEQVNALTLMAAIPTYHKQWYSCTWLDTECES